MAAALATLRSMRSAICGARLRQAVVQGWQRRRACTQGSQHTRPAHVHACEQPARRSAATHAAHRLEPAQREPAVHGREPRALCVLMEVQPLCQLGVPDGQQAQRGVAVPPHVLGPGRHADVSAQVQGPLVQRRQEAVVHHNQRAGGVRGSCDRADVAHLHAIQHAGAGAASTQAVGVERASSRHSRRAADRAAGAQGERALRMVPPSVSLTCMRGLVGDSTMTSCVLPGMMAALTALQRSNSSSSAQHAASAPSLLCAARPPQPLARCRCAPAPLPPGAHVRSVMSTLLTLTPAAGTTWLSSRLVPP